MSNVKKPAGKTGRKSAEVGNAVLRGEHVKSTVKPRYFEKYQTEVAPSFKKNHPNLNPMEFPRFVKIVVSSCQGDATQNIKSLESTVQELELICGQKAVMTRAKKSIAAFKLRAGMPIGALVTLRRERMYEFFDKLVNVTMPRIRDFRGVPTGSFDGKGNYSIGIKDYGVFPEIEADKMDKARGLSITIVTTAKNDELAREFLSLMQLPFRK
jgi:large subunit ribosomal protein L5